MAMRSTRQRFRRPFGLFTRESFFYKLILSFLLVVTLPVCGLSLYSFFLERQNAAAREKASLQFISDKIASDIDKYLVSNQNLVRHLALNSDVKDFLLSRNATPAQKSAFNLWLRSQNALSPEYSAIYVMDARGRCVASTDFSFIDKDYSVRYYFREPMRGKVYKSDWTIGLTSGEPGIYYSAPITNGMTIVGVMVLKMRTDKIAEMISFWKMGSKDAFLLNGAGILLTHSRPQYNYHSLAPLTQAQQADIDNNLQFARRSIPSIDLPILKRGLDRVFTSGQTEVIQYYFQDREKFAALTPLKEQNWAVGIAIPEEDIYTGSNLILRNTLVFSLLSLAASIIIALVMARLITSPIRNLTEKVKRFGRGEDSVRAEVESEDEIGQLAASFNQMADTISEHTHSLQEKVQQRTVELERANEELKHLSTRDPLTSCYNRRYLYEQLGHEIARAQRYGRWLTVIMADIDHFKSVNDTHGHSAGDAVLAAFSQLLQRGSRQDVDWVVRYGGEEFILVLPETDLERGRVVAERLCAAVAGQSIGIGTGREIRITASFGVASSEFSADDIAACPDDLTGAADRFLYSAKAAGRNCVVAEQLRIPAFPARSPARANEYDPMASP